MKQYSTNETPPLSLNEIKSQLTSIFIEEFYESFQEILLISQEDFIQKYIRRLNIILTSYYPNIIPHLKANEHLFNNIYQTIYEDYYLSTKYDCNSALKQGKKEVLTSFQPHCPDNAGSNPCHTCQGVFILVRDQNTKQFKYAICSNCKYVYHVNCILMYCPQCDSDFYSSFIEDEGDNLYQPATWEQYHCGILLNQQMTCMECGDMLWLKGSNKKLCCKTCKIESIPTDINWICVMCKKEFHTGAKIYNPLEFKAMKLSVKSAIANQVVIKPTSLPCKCCDNPLKLEFHHSTNCDGVLVKGEIFRKKIVVCSKCKIFSSLNKFKWICPLCEDAFKCSYTRNFPSQLNDNDNEFNIRNKNSPIRKAQSMRSSVEFGNILRYKSNDKLNNITSQREFNSAINKSKYINKNSDNDLRSSISNFNTKRKLFTDVPYLQTQDNDNIKAPVSSNSNNNSNNNKNVYMHYSKRNSCPEMSNYYYQTEASSTPNTSRNQFQSAYVNQSLTSSTQQKRINNTSSNNNNNFIFNVDDYTILTQLGQGTFGKIFLVEDHYKNIYCLKKLIINNQSNLTSLRNEYEIFTKCRHQNILTIHGLSEKKLDTTTYTIYILMEVAKTDWEKEINLRSSKYNFYTENEIIYILKQLTSALAYLQENKVSHRDVKAQNILVFDKNIYKIADFGEAKQFRDGKKILSTLRGTELYMSPILFVGLQNRTFDVKHNPYKSDVFSLGMCVLYACTLSIKMLCKVRDFTDNSKLRNFLNVALGKRYSQGLIDVLGRMLSIPEDGRPDFCQLKNVLGI